jgi:hypothetical protein
LIGVEELNGARSLIRGVTNHLADSDIQQFVNSKTNRPVHFSYESYASDDKHIGVISIPKQVRPFLLKSSYGKLKKDIVYARRGSSTTEVSLDEATRMAASDATEDWARKELEQQRREREEQSRVQQALHEKAYRPLIACDFPIIHSLQYLRLKNYGRLPAKDIKIEAETKITRSMPTGVTAIPPLACLQYPISFVAPGDELLYFLYGPQQFDLMPPEILVKLNYSDLEERVYGLTQIFNFSYLGDPGSNARGVDMGKENNAPLVQEVRRIGDFLTKRR